MFLSLATTYIQGFTANIQKNVLAYGKPIQFYKNLAKLL